MRKLLTGIWQVITAPFRIIGRIFASIGRWFMRASGAVDAFLTEEPDDEPLPDTFAKTIENPMGLFEHINALRKHLFRAVIFMACTTVISFLFTSKIIDLMAQPIGGISELRAIDVTESVGTFMRVALLSGFA